jgi:hypothetical protein
MAEESTWKKWMDFVSRTPGSTSAAQPKSTGGALRSGLYLGPGDWVYSYNSSGGLITVVYSPQSGKVNIPLSGTTRTAVLQEISAIGAPNLSSVQLAAKWAAFGAAKVVGSTPSGFQTSGAADVPAVTTTTKKGKRAPKATTAAGSTAGGGIPWWVYAIVGTGILGTGLVLLWPSSRRAVVQTVQAIPARANSAVYGILPLIIPLMPILTPLAVGGGLYWLTHREKTVELPSTTSTPFIESAVDTTPAVPATTTTGEVAKVKRQRRARTSGISPWVALAGVAGATALIVLAYSMYQSGKRSGYVLPSRA